VRERLKTIGGALVIDFSNRDMGLLGVATIAVAFATGCFTIALGIYGFEAHGAVGVGVVALVRFLPGALTVPIVSLFIDRHSRRAVLFGCSVATLAVLSAATIAAALDAPVPVVFAFAALFTIANCGYGPAHSALTPSLVQSPQQLSASNVTHIAMEYVGTLLAALTAGILLTATSPGFVFGVAAAAATLVLALVAGVRQDRRPEYEDDEEEEVVRGALHEVTFGLRTMLGHSTLRLATATLILLFLFEGFAGVVVVVMALDLLGLPQGSVGFLNATWGIGAVIGAMSLAALLNRGRLVGAIAGGSILLGTATMLPGLFPEPPFAYVGWLLIGTGFVFVEVAAKTLLQRLGSDETLGRMIGSLEAGRFAAKALGSIGAVLLLELLGVRASLIALGALMPVFVTLFWTRLRAHEIGAPVDEGRFVLLRANPIFAPLPIAVLEGLSHNLVPVEATAGEDVIVQGELGDRFYVIVEGEVEVFEDGVFKRNEGPGESFGEIALLHEVRRTATVRATVDTRLLSLDGDQFVLAVTGHRRSHQRARSVAADRYAAPIAS
jgi:MFS family permease